MKKLISILILFALMIGAATGEIVYITKFYSKQLNLLNNVESLMDVDSENIDRDEVSDAVDKAFAHFEKGKRFVMMIGNHNSVKYVDERLVALRQLIKMNQQYDAYVALNTAKSYIEDLKEDVLPKLTNLF